MRFEKALCISSRLVALSGLGALLITREAPDWLVFPVMALAMLGMAYPERYEKKRLPRGVPTALVIAFFAFSVLDFFYISGSLVLAGADFIVLLIALKLFSLDTSKDYIQLYALSLFVLLASTGVSTEIYFLCAFIMYFVSLTWALMLLNVKAESQRVSGRPPRWGVSRGFFAGTAALTLASTAFTLGIFLVIPRIGIGYFSKHAGGLLKASGFSDKVELGSIGEVLQDPSVVMRVELPGSKERPDGQVYWRGRAFDVYKGDSWEVSDNRALGLYRMPGGLIYTKPGARTPDALVEQRISLEPLETNTIFTLYPSYMVAGDFRTLFLDRQDGLHLSSPPGGRITYTVYSAPKSPILPELKGENGAYPPRFMEGYLQLPDGAGELARLAGGIVDNSATPYVKAAAIRKYLRENYAYTLNPKRDTRYAPLDDFLFHSKAGYCEHFATAMTLMLRSVGVPARLVSGFSGGEWNRYGSYFLVREQDAHTWVEVFFPRSGWVVFDPTPEARGVRPVSAFAGLLGLIDYLKFKWDRNIVFFSLHDQLTAAREAYSMLHSIRQGAGSALAYIKDAFSGGQRQGVSGGPGAGRFPLGALGMAAALAGAALLLKIALRGPRKRVRAVVGFYAEMEGLLKKAGFVRTPSATPLEFALSFKTRDEDLYEGVLYITRLYNRARFGGTLPGPDEERKVKEILSRLVAWRRVK